MASVHVASPNVTSPTSSEPVGLPACAAAASETAARTRFAAWRPGFARALLGLLAALVVYGAAFGPVPKPGAPASGIAAPADPDRLAPGDPENYDFALYRAIAQRISEGQGYYAAAVAEHRRRSYPLKPFVTVRPPTLAFIQGRLGEANAALLLAGLVGATLIALAARLPKLLPLGRTWMAILGLAALGLAPALIPVFVLSHEAWAAALIALSLACRSADRFRFSLVLGLLAVGIRELALPYLAVMAVLAWWEGGRREAVAWLAAIALSAGALAVHAATVAAYTQAGDLASPGWASAAGWPLVLTMMRESSFLVALPMPAVAALVPLCLVGWASWGTALGDRGALLLGGYVCAFMVVARPDNVYWGGLIAPLLFVGLAFAPRALRDLWRAARWRSASFSRSGSWKPRPNI